MARRGFDWRLCVRFCAALALVLVAFGHKPLDLGYAGIPDAASYAFPDGSIPVICVTSPGDAGENPTATHGVPCGACLVAGSVILPIPADVGLPILRDAGQVFQFAIVQAPTGSAWPPAAPPRAPPLA